MKLYEIYAGITYWVAANDPEDAIRVLRNVDHHAVEALDTNEGLAELSQADAILIECDTQNGRTNVTMWQAFTEMAAAGVVACSEY